MAAVLTAAGAMAATATAQEDVAPASPSATAPTAAPACCVVANGLPVVLELVDEVSSATAVRGDRFAIQLAESVRVDGQVVIPAGARGVGEVIDAGKAGMGGRPGELVVAARYITMGDVQVPIRGFRLGGHGENLTKDAQTVVILAGVGGLLMRGGDLVMPAGARGSAKIARDVTLPPAPAQPRDADPAQAASQEGK